MLSGGGPGLQSRAGGRDVPGGFDSYPFRFLNSVRESSPSHCEPRPVGVWQSHFRDVRADPSTTLRASEGACRPQNTSHCEERSDVAICLFLDRGRRGRLPPTELLPPAAKLSIFPCHYGQNSKGRGGIL